MTEGCCFLQLEWDLPVLQGLSIPMLIVLGATSFLTGIMGGLVGIVLGIIRLPVMILLGLDPYVAAGTNLAVTAIASWLSLMPAFVRRNVLPRLALFIGAPGIFGAFIGGYFAREYYAKGFPIWIPLAFIVVFLLWSSTVILAKAYSDIKSRKIPIQKPYRRTWKSTTTESGMGFAIGALGGAVGLALGVVRLPAMIQILKVNPVKAASTNLLVTGLVSIAGLAGHLLQGSIDWVLVAIVGITAIAGMYIGAKLASRMDSRQVRLVMGLVLLGLTPLVVWTAIRDSLFGIN